MTTISTPPIQRVALYQLLILLPVCGIVSGFDVTLAGSMLVGGLIQIIPQAWYARQAFRYRGARQVNKIVRAMYWGESGKVILTAALFVTTFILWKQLNVLAVFCAFIVMIPVGWLITLKVLNS
ncbi:MAG: ATP synthase subunit I [Porticoccaceae bacterium]